MVISPLCTWCEDQRIDTANHYLKECSRFTDASEEDKRDLVWRKRLCLGCLSPNHSIKNYDDRPRVCPKCSRKHSDIIPCSGSKVSFLFTGGSSFHKPTYSRTVSVVLRHCSKSDKKLEGLAIIDEGSATTLVNGSFLSGLDIPEQSLSSAVIKVTTVGGEMLPKSYRTIKGLRTSGLSNSKVSHNLGECVEWKELQRDVDEIPSPEEVAQFEELKHLSSQFPPVDLTWPTLMLIGRDNMWAMTHAQYVATKVEEGFELRKIPVAIQTPLGWTLVGPKPSKKAGPLPFNKKEGIFQFSCGTTPLDGSNDIKEKSNSNMPPSKFLSPGG